MNVIDTADAYGPFVSERLLAGSLQPYPDGLVIAYWVGLIRPDPTSWQPDASPQHLDAACGGSLRRRELDQIRLFQLHRVDPTIPFAESVGAIVELTRSRKIAQIGLSNISVDELARRGHSPRAIRRAKPP